MKDFSGVTKATSVLFSKCPDLRALRMSQLRVRHYKLLSRAFSHGALVVFLLTVYEAVTTPRVDTIAWALCFIVAYLQYLLVGKEWVDLNLHRLKFLAYFTHIIQFFLLAATAWSPTGFTFATFQLLGTVARLLQAFAFLNPRTTLFFEVLFSATEVFVHFCFFEEANAQFFSSCLCQILISILTVASSSLVDMAFRGRIYALLDATNAESLLSSFRRVLRGLCDGEVLLDSQMHVSQESECLKHLILTSVSLKGRFFEDLLADEDRHRFREFIVASSAAFEEIAPPFCSRVGFRGSAGIRVAVDIYHVPVPGLFGAVEPYHLIAFKEDDESRALPDAAEDSVPDELSWNRHQGSHLSHLDVTASSQASRGSARSSHAVDPELQEMTLLIDVDSSFQDVKQAHLKFQRNWEEGVSSSMPSLRKLVKPTAWEDMRLRVGRFVERALRDPGIEPKELSKLAVQLPGQNGWFSVDEAFLHRIQGARNVWLHLKGFHPEKVQRPPSLDGIQETLGGMRQRGRPPVTPDQSTS